ncbi:MAG: hypothetical protein ABJH63_07040 [Rhizobiaceae bacterium]
MLESGLFFTLGFLCSALLALMVAPAIWRRAVVLTRNRIESSVPLTLNEIQADKDQLRAEFAMSTRRLEVNLESLKERASEQLVDINKKRDELLSLEDQHAEKSLRISELETQAAELRSEMRERESQLNATQTDLASVELKLEEKAFAYEELERKYRTAIEEFDSKKVEMIAREGRLDIVEDQAREAKQLSKHEASENTKLRKELKAAETAVSKERNRVENHEKKIERMQASLADLEGRIERRDADLERLRSKSGDAGDQVGDLQNLNDELQAEKFRLESEVAQTTLRMEALLKDASGENIENAVATFESERQELRDQLRQAELERDELKVELSSTLMSNGEDWEVERRENAVMRERINDLAAKVTSMTAALEGPESPISKAVGKKAGSKAKQAADANAAAETPTSLAERIRALQAAAEQA